jgi:DNA-binding transcriptional regulator GbsR (MarR family)
MTSKTTSLPAAASRFVLHWGEMGSRWGINRSVAQVQALLYVSGRPLNAEEIVAALGLARSNVSTALRDLQAWGLARLVHVPGDRRDHFVTLGDAWEMIWAVVAERKRRELDPAIALLRECLGEGKSGDDARLKDLLELFESAAAFYEQVRDVPKAKLLKAMTLARQLLGLLDGGEATPKAGRTSREPT